MSRSAGDNIKHGSRTSYVYRKCRCPECKRANAEYKRNKAADHRNATASTAQALIEAGVTVADPKLTHGLPSSYEWYGCRCRPCTDAAMHRQRLYRLNDELETAS